MYDPLHRRWPSVDEPTLGVGHCNPEPATFYSGFPWSFAQRRKKGERIGLGRLPGDIVVRGRRSTFGFPLATCLLLSILFSVLLRLFQRWAP